MALAGVGEFTVIDINDDQPKKGYCTVFLSESNIKKKSSKLSLKQTSNSVHLTVTLDADKSLEFKVKRLPGEIADNGAEAKISDGKVTLKLKKKDAKNSWAAHASDNLECDL